MAFSGCRRVIQMKKQNVGQYQQQWDSYYTDDCNYYRETVPETPRRFALDGIFDADVCIIGAGFTGLSVAYNLRDAGLNVAVLERHEVGWGASGRCGGQILPGYSVSLTQAMQKKYGKENVKALWDCSIRGLNAVKEICREHSIDCDLKPGAMYVSNTPDDDREIREYAENLARDFDYHLDYKPVDSVREMLGTGVYHSGVFMPDAAHFHPVKYIKALAHVVDLYARIFESTPAEAIRRDGTGYFIHTPGGGVKAHSIVLCGDSYLGNLVPQLRRKYVLIRNAIIGTEAIPEESRVVPADICVFEVSNAMNYYRKGADSTFLIGAGDIVRQNANGDMTQEKIVVALKKEMSRIFPVLEKTQIRYQWGGDIGFTNTLLPNVGKLDDHVYYANGYSGHGINVTHGVGYLLARAVSGGGDEYKAFECIKNMPYPGQGRWDRHLAFAGLHIHGIQEKIESAWRKTVHGRK